jgi:hypothetical protein
MARAQLVTDLEGPLTLNDNAFEITVHFQIAIASVPKIFCIGCGCPLATTAMLLDLWQRAWGGI